MNNILIGPYAGIEITTESFQLRIKGKIKNEKGIYEEVDIKETMSEREYYLISNVVRAMSNDIIQKS
jgi:hypothetical protein